MQGDVPATVAPTASALRQVAIHAGANSAKIADLEARVKALEDAANAGKYPGARP